jgi:hypothetical protein
MLSRQMPARQDFARRLRRRRQKIFSPSCRRAATRQRCQMVSCQLSFSSFIYAIITPLPRLIDGYALFFRRSIATFIEFHASYAASRGLSFRR